MSRATLWLVLVLAGCSPAPMKQPLDAAPGHFLELLRGGDLAGAAALCRQDVSWFDAGGEQHGVQALTIPPGALIDAHHDVARLTREDGSLLFVRSDGAGTITEVVHFPASGPSDTPAQVKAYQDSWNVEAGPRAALLSQGWSPTSRYEDPTAVGLGPGGLSFVVDDFRGRFPGAHLAADPALQRVAGGWVTFGWTLTSGSSELKGFDVGQLDQAGLPQFIAGFFSPR